MKHLYSKKINKIREYVHANTCVGYCWTECYGGCTDDCTNVCTSCHGSCYIYCARGTT